MILDRNRGRFERLRQRYQLNFYRNGEMLRHPDRRKVVAMRRFIVASSIHRIVLPGLAILALGLIRISCGSATAQSLGPEINSWSLTKVQANGPVAPPHALVLHGASPETERVAALFAAIGLFEVLISPPEEEWGITGEKLDLENSERCRSDAQTLSPDSIKVECIQRAPRGPLPGCRLQIDLTGPPASESVARRARIYVVLDHGEPCPFYDQRYLRDDLRMNGLRPWRTSRLVADLDLPTTRSILRAVGIDVSADGR